MSVSAEGTPLLWEFFLWRCLPSPMVDSVLLLIRFSRPKVLLRRADAPPGAENVFPRPDAGSLSPQMPPMLCDSRAQSCSRQVAEGSLFLAWSCDEVARTLAVIGLFLFPEEKALSPPPFSCPASEYLCARRASPRPLRGAA